MFTSMPTKPETCTYPPALTAWLNNGELGAPDVLITSRMRRRMMPWEIVVQNRDAGACVCADCYDTDVIHRGEAGMRKRLLVVLTLSIGVTALLLAAVGQAGAARGASVSGTYNPTDFGTSTCVPVGASGFMFRCDTRGFVSEYSGDLTGFAVADFSALINCKTQREIGHGSETFTGSMGAVSGTLSWTDVFSADIDCTTFFPFNLDINAVAVKGSGGFAGTRGKLTFTDTTYNGSLR